MHKKDKNKINKGIKTLLSLSVISISVYIGFTPLLGLFEETITKSVVTSAFSVIFVVILTMFLLNKQTELEQETKRREKVFDEKVKIYSRTLIESWNVLKDGKISSQSILDLASISVHLQMLGSNKIIEYYSVFYINVINYYQIDSDTETIELDGNKKIELYKNISEFAEKCREDLDLSNNPLPDDLFDKFAMSFGRGNDAVMSKKDNTRYLYKGQRLGKGRLVLAIITDYVAHNKNITYAKLKEAFPDSLQKNRVFEKLESAREKFMNTNRKRFFDKDEEIITLSDCSIVVSNQWGIGNINEFIDHCRDNLGITIN